MKTTMTVILPLPPKELMSRRSPYTRKGQQYAAALRKKYRTECAYMTIVSGGGFKRVLKADKTYPKVKLDIQITYTLRNQRSKQDNDNLLRWIKSGIDGIADAIKIDDRHYTFLPIITLYNSHKQGVVVEVSIAKP